jgi:hypothetical protein
MPAFTDAWITVAALFPIAMTLPLLSIALIVDPLIDIVITKGLGCCSKVHMKIADSNKTNATGAVNKY